MIKHIMKDGEVVKDIQGRVVTLNDKTEKAYRLLSEKGEMK